MRTIRTKVYQFSELSEPAQENAVSIYATSSEQFFGSEEAIKSLEKFAEHFGTTLKKYEIDWSGGYCPSFADFDTEDFCLNEKELKERIKAMGEYNKKTLKGFGDCVFTGVCYDEDCADGARKAYFEGEREIENILQAGFKSLMESCHSEYEYQFSKQGYAEFCEANEYEFKADGTRF